MILTAGRVMEQISKENKNEEVNYISGADPGFFLGWIAPVSCSTSTLINHIVLFFFFCRIPVVSENRRSSQGGGMRTPCTLPLDPPLYSCMRPMLLRKEWESKTRRKWLSFHFTCGRNLKSRFSVVLCSESKRKRLLRRLRLIQYQRNSNWAGSKRA